MALKELTEFYIPERILHREQQLNEIREVFKRFKEYGTAKNILIQGFSGTGKTASINKILSEQTNSFIYVSGAQQITAHQVLRAITDMTFTTRERLLSEAIRKFRQDPHVIIIDEINKLKRQEEIRWLFNDINTLYRETGCPIILITNMREILKIPDHDAIRTLFFRVVEFKPYDALQIREILEDRINLIKAKYGKEINLPEDFLPFVSAAAIKESEGSARLALLLTQECILTNNFSQEYIKQILTEMKQSEWEQFIVDLPEVERKFLSLLLVLAERNKLIPISEIIKKVKDYPPQRISQMIASLEGYGVIERATAATDKRMKTVQFVSEDIFEKLNGLTKDIMPLT